MREVLNKAINKYKVRKVRVMADRGLFSESNLSFFEGLKKRGLKGEYILSCPLRKLSISTRKRYWTGIIIVEGIYLRRRVIMSSDIKDVVLLSAIVRSARSRIRARERDFG